MSCIISLTMSPIWRNGVHATKFVQSVAKTQNLRSRFKGLKISHFCLMGVIKMLLGLVQALR